jgi:DNA-binding NtrC family response regulator
MVGGHFSKTGIMKKPGIAIIDADAQNGRQLCTFLAGLNYSAALFNSLEDLEDFLKHDPEIAVILDLDSIPIQSQAIRSLKKRHPQLHILGVSKLLFHPGLEEVIGSYLYACLVKPLDEEELLFLLKSIVENMEGPAAAADS